MYKTIFNKRGSFKFKHFSNKGYALFACLGREVLVGTLSITTLAHASAESVSTRTDKVSTDSTISYRETLDEVSVMGSRAPLTQSQQARMVTVLSREEIQAAPVQSVNDLLKYAVGVDVRQRAPIGAQTDISVRGGNYQRVTVLLNGINICDPQTGHNAFDFPVDISEIKRIEVIEGPAGSVYGTSSLVGAINIVTEEPKQSSVDAHLEGGSFGYASAGGRVNIAQGRWNNQISGSYSRSDGYQRNAQGGLNADYSGAKAFYQGRYDDDDVTVKWHAGLSSKDWGSGTSYAVKYDDQFEHTFKTYTAVQMETKKGIIKLMPSIYWNHQYDRFELFRGDDAQTHKVPFNYHRTDIYGVNINAYFDWLLGRTAFGAELRNEDLVSTKLGDALRNPISISGTDRNYVKGLNRTNIQFALEHNILIDRFTLSAGIIAMKNSWAEMNMRVYPSVNASYRIGDSWKVYASYNTSLRMPSATELFYSIGGYLADPTLKPEELSAVEVGVKYHTHAVTGSVSAFHNHYTNLIDWITDGTKDENGSLIYKSVNFGTINALGVETVLDLDFGLIWKQQHLLKNIQMSYCYMKQHQHEYEGIQSLYALEYLKNKWVTNVRLNLFRKLDLNLSYRLQNRTGSYKDITGALQTYGTYGLLDAKLLWNEEKWNVYVQGNNLTDKHYVDVGNVPQPGIWVIAGAAIHLNL